MDERPPLRRLAMAEASEPDVIAAPAVRCGRRAQRPRVRHAAGAEAEADNRLELSDLVLVQLCRWYAAKPRLPPAQALP